MLFQSISPAADLPTSAHSYFVRGAKQAMDLMKGHPRAIDELNEAMQR
jgi:hypothetical protein